MTSTYLRPGELPAMTTQQACAELRERGYEICTAHPGRIAARNGGWLIVLDQTSHGWRRVGGGPTS